MRTPPIKISVSILSANFSKLQEEIDAVKGAEYMHIDVMDGHFVPNLSFGAVVIKDLKSDMVRDVHLMVTDPADYIEPFVKAGANIITVHAETVENLPEILDEIKAKGAKAGVSLNPDTPMELIISHLDKIDHILIMSVNPGFAGQKFMDKVLQKISILRLQYKGDIAIDGGINPENAFKAVQAGANVLVAASFIYKHKSPRKAIEELREAARNAQA